MRTIRRLLRNLLTKLPGGEKLLLPRIRLIYDRLPFLDWRTKRYCADEAKKVRNLAQVGNREAIIVFDSKVTGLAYGTIIYMAAIGRYMTANGIYVKFYLVESGHPHAFGIYEEHEIRDFIINAQLVLKVLLDPEKSSISIVPEEEFGEYMKSVKNEFLLFDEFTKTRRPFFRDCFNVFNNLMSDIDEELMEEVLFSSNEFVSALPKSFRITNYVSWHCRFSTKGTDVDRRVKIEEFRQCYKYLQVRYPGHPVVIVSDRIGCEHYRSLAAQLSIEQLSFSKDYSTTFIEDAAIIMNSDVFFSYRGGGIGAIQMLSLLPYEWFGPLMNEIHWDKKRLTSWQTESQRFVQLEKHQFVEDRTLDIGRLIQE